MIQIKRNNKVFFTLEDFGEGSKLSYQLMDHHYIILKFTTATPIYFEIGDSVEIPDFGYFELTSSYFPKHNDSDGYDYEMQMDAYYMSWKNKICKYRPQHGANETSFNLTTTVGVHMNVILGNLKALGLTYNGKDFSVDYTTYNNKAFDVQKRFLIEYGSISILDALNAICSEDALNCEWWIDGSIIYLGYCEMEGQTTFEQDVNVLSMSYSESKSTYITRLYAFGSDRNIPKGYFTGADADVTTDGVATDYLMLPNKEVDSDGFYAKDGYLENVNVVKNDKQAIEGVVMFEDEYPKVESVVSSIKTYDSTVDNEDGTKTTQTFWQVTATDSFATNFEASWIKSNLTLGIKFTSGALMGMEFDVSFKVIDKVNYFEIVANDTYGRTLPDGVMCPKVGDKFFLYNWDATKITDTDLIPTAQLSLFDRAKQYYQKTMISNSNFTCTMDGDKFYNNGTYDYHPLGEQVKLINDMFAQVDADGKHYRNSRIIGMEIPLDIPYDHPQYTVGEKAATSRLGKLEDKVDSITVNGTQIGGIGSGNGGGGVYVIGMNDSTTPTDSNVLSARKSINSFLSKLTDDTAKGLITFAKGLIAKGLADLMMGARFGNNAMITKLGEAVFSAIKSLDYDNAAEQGFSVEKEKNGKYHAFFTNLTIWGKARFHELEVRKLSYSGGNIYLSGAGSKLVRVVPVKKLVSADGVTSWVETTDDDVECVGWKCYLLADNGTTATMNDWQEGDQARCQTMGEIVSGGTYQNASNKSYWRTIPDGGVSTQNEKIYGTKTETYLDEDGNEQTKGVQVELYDGQAFAWIVIGKHCGDIDGYDDEFGVGYNGSNPAPLETRDIPSAGDTIVLDGNRHRNKHGEYDKTDRQNVIILETTGEYAPRIACYANITEYKHTFTKSVNGSDKEVSLSVFETSPKGGTKINSSRFEWISDDGSTINIINYRGDWEENNTYHKNDQVNYNNAVWVCVANSGVDVADKPSEGSSNWKKVLSGGKGEKGDDAVSYSVSLMKELRTIAGHSNQSAVAVSFRKQEGSKSTVSGNIATFGDSASVKCYIDGEHSDNMTDWINSGNDYFGYLNYEDAWAGKSVITVVMYIDGNIVASSNFSLGQSGEGVVMAYKNATSRPSKPTVEDLSQLSDGWSRTPQKGGSYLKVDNISYGSFDNGASSSVDSTSKSWTDVTEGGNSWKKSPSGLSDNYGWAIMKVSFSTNVDNSDVKVTIKAYSEGNYDFIQVHALDTEITGSSSLRKTGVADISGNGIETSYSYHVTTAGQHFFYVSYCKDSSGNSNGDYGLFRFDLSDNLVSMPSTVWMSQATLKDGKAVLPWSTPVQITGDDAYRVEVSPSTLVFDTNKNGLVDSATLSGKYAAVTVYKGKQKISTDNLSLPSNYATKKHTNVDGKISNVNGEARITIDRIEQETISGDEKVSKSSGQISFPIDVFGERSTLMWVTVNVQVNVSKFTGSVAFDNKGYKAQFDELSKGGGAATKNELTQATSKFEQTAREISLSVSEKSIARRNLLVGSAFLREDNNRIISNDARIEINSGYQGTNCIHVIDATEAGNPHYVGAYWDGSQDGRSIKIEKGKKYTMSCFCKTNDINAEFYLEAIYTDKQENATRKGQAKYLSPSEHTVKKVNEWELFTTVIDTTDAEYDYIAFNFWEACNIIAGRIDAWICRPMVEEGDTYNGWTLSQNDYDIIGANLIDNSRTLDVGGNILTVIGKKTLVGDVYELTASGSDDYNQFYRIKGDAFKLNTDYTLSFEVRGDAKYLEVNAFYPANNTKYTCYIEQQNNVMYEIAGDGTTAAYVILGQFKVLSKQQKVWVHFRFKDRLPEQIYFQFPSNADQIGVTSWNVTIARPKIEVGAVVTEYTERKTDLIDKATLKKAGIEITSDQVILYGNKVQVKNPKENPSEGYDEAAMFQNGKLNAQFINAGDIVAEGIKTQELEAQHLTVTGNSRLGIFEIRTAEKDDRDQYTIGGDAIQYSGGYKFPDGKTEAFDAGSFLMYKPMFIRQGSPDDYAYMRLGHQFTEWDDGNISGGSKNYFFVGAAARYVCSGEEFSCTRNVLPVALKYNSDIKPAAYVYSVLAKDSAAFAIYTKAVGTAGERLAIQTNGAIRGVEALNIETIYRSQQISSGIGAARCINTAEITIRLPINPVVGQKFYVLQEDTGKVNITGDSNHQIILFNKRIVTTCNSNTKGQISIFIWSGNYWFGSFFTGIL